MDATVRLRKDFLKKYMSEMQMNQEMIGQRIGFKQPHVSRVLSGDVDPNAKFVARTMAAFEAPFDRFFFVEEETS